MSRDNPVSYAKTGGEGSKVYFHNLPGSKRISVGIEGPRGGQGDVAYVSVDGLLDALITAVGPLAVTTAIAEHKRLGGPAPLPTEKKGVKRWA